MPVTLPKYAHWVAERRFLVDPDSLPKDLGSARRIADLTAGQAFQRQSPDLAVFTGPVDRSAAFVQALRRFGLECMETV